VRTDSGQLAQDAEIDVEIRYRGGPKPAARRRAQEILIRVDVSPDIRIEGMTLSREMARVALHLRHQLVPKKPPA
jgi:hypothetical protein